MPAKAGIQQLQGPFWIPALRSVAAGMTSFVAGLVKNPGPEDLALVCPLEGGSPRLCSVQHTYGVLKLLQAEPIISDLALRALGSTSRKPKEPGFQISNTKPIRFRQDSYAQKCR